MEEEGWEEREVMGVVRWERVLSGIAWVVRVLEGDGVEGGRREGEYRLTRPVLDLCSSNPVSVSLLIHLRKKREYVKRRDINRRQLGTKKNKDYFDSPNSDPASIPT